MTSLTTSGMRTHALRVDRIVALDLARLLAIFGMIAAHVFFGKAPDAINVVVTGFPAALFALLGGVSAVLSSRTHMEQGRVFAACASVVTRGLIIAIIGIVLGFLPNFIVMVLAYYGVALMVVGLMLWLPTWILASAAAILVVASPHLILLVRDATTAEPIAVPSLDSPLAFVQTVGFTGFYPAITWVTYMLIGVCVGRWLRAEPLSTARGLRAAAAGAGLAFVAIASDLSSRAMTIGALRQNGHSLHEAQEMLSTEGHGTPLGGGWIAMLNASPHTGSSADILRTVGVAILVIGLLVAATAHTKSVLPQPFESLARAGAAPLTIYVFQYGSVPIMLIGGSLLLPEREWIPVLTLGTLLVHAVVVIGFGRLLSRLDRRGPLEALVSASVKAVVRPTS